MEEKIFRKKSIEQLSAPEELTGYLRVTGPGVWVVLAGLITLLCGLLVWGIFGTIISSKTVPAIAEKGRISCYILEKDLDLSDETIEINVGDVQMTADPGDAKLETLGADDDPILFQSGYLSHGKNVYVLTGETSLADGFYSATVITEQLRPVSLLFSKK